MSKNHSPFAIALAFGVMITSGSAAAQVVQPGQAAQDQSEDAQQPTSDGSKYETTVVPEGSESGLVGPYGQPRWSARRRFPTTRVYVIPAGHVALEWWWEGKYNLSDSDSDARHRQQYELELGLGHRLQLDLYLTTEQNGFGPVAIHEEKVELRYAFADWNVIPTNPTVYLEFVRQSDGPHKGELKGLFGGDISPLLHWGANIVYEREFGGEHEQEYALTAGVAYGVIDNKFSFGGEVKLETVDVDGDRFAFDAYEGLAGPSVQWSPVPMIHIDAVLLLGAEHEDGDTVAIFEPTVVVGATL
jgi:hypothetical protein